MAGQQNIKQRGTHLPVGDAERLCCLGTTRKNVCVRLRFPLPNVHCTLISQTRH